MTSLAFVIAFVACQLDHPDRCRVVELEASSPQACVLLGQMAIAQWMRLYPGHHVGGGYACREASTPA